MDKITQQIKDHAFKFEALKKFLTLVSHPARMHVDLKFIKTLAGRIRGELDRNDIVKEHNAFEMAEFKRLFQNNLLFFLTIVGDYKLYRRYWLHAGFSEREYVMKCYLLQENNQALKPQAPLLLIPVKLSTTATLAHNLLDTTIHEKQLTAIQTYWQVHREYGYVIEDYRNQQLNALVNRYNDNLPSYHSELERLLTPKDNLTLSPDIDSLRSHAKRIQDDSNKIREDLSAEKNKKHVNQDGSTNHLAMKRAMEQIRVRDENLSKEILEFNDKLKGFNHKLNAIKTESNNLHPMIHSIETITSNIIHDVNRHKQTMQRIDDTFIPRIKDYKDKLAVLSKEIRLDNVRYLNTLVNMLQDCRNEATPNEKSILISCIDQLNNYKIAISTTNDVAIQQDILKKCALSLSPLQEIIQKSPPSNGVGLKCIIPILSSIQALLTEKSLQRTQPVVSAVDSVNLDKQAGQNQYLDNKFDFMPTLNPKDPTPPLDHSIQQMEIKANIGLVKEQQEIGSSEENEEQEIPEDILDNVRSSLIKLRYTCQNADLENLLDKINHDDYKRISLNDINSINNAITRIAFNNPEDNEDLKVVLEALTHVREFLEEESTPRPKPLS